MSTFKEALSEYRKWQLELAIWEDIVEHLRSRKEKPIYDDSIGTIDAGEIEAFIKYIEDVYVNRLRNSMAKIEETEVEDGESEGAADGEVQQEEADSRPSGRGRGKGKGGVRVARRKR